MLKLLLILVLLVLLFHINLSKDVKVIDLTLFNGIFS
jgi:hypothetical protein